MAYRYSKTDTDNIAWFKNDMTKGTLLGIELSVGKLRGLSHFSIDLQYPITVLAGKNCSGKSTLLAMASCAYHNLPRGYKLPSRKISYYTFSDFFIQSKEEIPPQGIKIRYKILHDDWRVSKRLPDGKGIGIQSRIKKIGGKWNDYSTRVNRNVVYLGIERVVPYSERTVYKNYRSYFKKIEKLGWEKKVKNTVGKILGKKYDDFWFINHYKYRIPVVKVGRHIYSGFNMGAGENALFEIFSIIYGCPKGVLIIIDEIELGLHEEALYKFIEELKQICLSEKAQIIATTHSQTVLKNLPPIARFYIENLEEKTILTDSITALYAAGKLAGENSNELDVFVEDRTAKKILELALTTEIRNRINILSIGSSSAISRQLAARYKNLKKGECIAIMDGDKKEFFNENKKIFINALESEEVTVEMENWLNQRIEYLPGSTWPESWVLNEIKASDCKFLCSVINIDKGQLIHYIEEALRAGKHNEFYILAKKVNLERDLIISSCAIEVINIHSETFKILENFIISRLNSE
jgi:predicted ATPase